MVKNAVGKEGCRRGTTEPGDGGVLVTARYLRITATEAEARIPPDDKSSESKSISRIKKFQNDSNDNGSPKNRTSNIIPTSFLPFFCRKTSLNYSSRLRVEN